MVRYITTQSVIRYWSGESIPLNPFPSDDSLYLSTTLSQAISKGLFNMVNSRAKGARVERELSKLLREYGYDARRGQQFCGANGDADVISSFPFYIECKAVQNLNVHKALEQAKGDCPEDETACVIHKKNGTKFLVTLELEDLLAYFDGLFRDNI